MGSNLFKPGLVCAHEPGLNVFTSLHIWVKAGLAEPDSHLISGEIIY
ncbi:hypothetical protein DCCM_3245 [Desulfocucumis palustris]|uniref:Uncharacterized protein n=1 Tax=Desulfocucumis palustris TaxID=1898651 RepID=A0A2L2XEJ6_9FIRM|nr:hypothetical protein DCCM_3245 [Desulfocucumis palustris]